MSDSKSRPQLEPLLVDVASMRRRGESHGRVEVDLPVAWLAATLIDTDAEVREPGKVEIDLSLPSDGPVIVSGRLHTRFVVPCGRCLEDADVDGGTRFEALFVLGRSERAPTREEDEDGLALDDDALDTWTYAGTTVDLHQVVAEYVKVAYPMRALCPRGDACQGLCSGCGNNFNEIAPRVAGNRAFCTECGQEFFGPVGEPPSDDQTAAEAPKSGALADALRKLQLPD